MKRLTASDFRPELLELYDFYAHGMITKREFLDRAGKFALHLLAVDVQFAVDDQIRRQIGIGHRRPGPQRGHAGRGQRKRFCRLQVLHSVSSQTLCCAGLLS